MTSPFEIDFDGALIRGEAAGFGIPVVFLHSGVTDRRMWSEQMQQLAAEGYHVISYDRRGYGQTETADVPFNHLIDLETVLDRLSVHAAIFVGSSMGGALAVDFALEHPNRTVALVLMGTGVTGSEGFEPDEEAEQLEEAFEYAKERGNISMANRIQAHQWLDGPYGESGRVTGPVRELFLAMNEIHLNHAPLTKEERPDWLSTTSIRSPRQRCWWWASSTMPTSSHCTRTCRKRSRTPSRWCSRKPRISPASSWPDLFDPILFEFLEAVTGQGEDDEDED